MRTLGLPGVRRDKGERTTIPANDGMIQEERMVDSYARELGGRLPQRPTAAGPLAPRRVREVTGQMEGARGWLV